MNKQLKFATLIILSLCLLFSGCNVLNQNKKQEYVFQKDWDAFCDILGAVPEIESIELDTDIHPRGEIYLRIFVGDIASDQYERLFDSTIMPHLFQKEILLYFNEIVFDQYRYPFTKINLLLNGSQGQLFFESSRWEGFAVWRDNHDSISRTRECQPADVGRFMEVIPRSSMELVEVFLLENSLAEWAWIYKDNFIYRKHNDKYVFEKMDEEYIQIFVFMKNKELSIDAVEAVLFDLLSKTNKDLLVQISKETTDTLDTINLLLSESKRPKKTMIVFFTDQVEDVSEQTFSYSPFITFESNETDDYNTWQITSSSLFSTHVGDTYTARDNELVRQGR